MHFIYAIGTSDPKYPSIKIGTTSDIKHRLSNLQSGSPIELSVLSAWEFPCSASARVTEQLAHSVFSTANHYGEWFNVSIEEIDKFITRDSQYDLAAYGVQAHAGKRLEVNITAHRLQSNGIRRYFHHVARLRDIEKARIAKEAADKKERDFMAPFVATMVAHRDSARVK